MEHVPTGDNLTSVLRHLAKSDYWQSVFSISKEFRMPLFENIRDFTPLQVNFIGYLSFYDSLNNDVAMGEITDIIFENDIYEDAYACYRNHTRKNLKNKKRDTAPKTENQDTWVFKKPGKPKN